MRSRPSRDRASFAKFDNTVFVANFEIIVSGGVLRGLAGVATTSASSTKANGKAPVKGKLVLLCGPELRPRDLIPSERALPELLRRICSPNYGDLERADPLIHAFLPPSSEQLDRLVHLGWI
jgi:hypothetical protein